MNNYPDNMNALVREAFDRLTPATLGEIVRDLQETHLRKAATMDSRITAAAAWDALVANCGEKEAAANVMSASAGFHRRQERQTVTQAASVYLHALRTLRQYTVDVIMRDLEENDADMGLDAIGMALLNAARVANGQTLYNWQPVWDNIARLPSVDATVPEDARAAIHARFEALGPMFAGQYAAWQAQGCKVRDTSHD